MVKLFWRAYDYITGVRSTMVEYHTIQRAKARRNTAEEGLPSIVEKTGEETFSSISDGMLVEQASSVESGAAHSMSEYVESFNKQNV
ncbi:MAG: hypothetical protein RL557_886 [archaeon]|jgi:hypothetical protein